MYFNFPTAKADNSLLWDSSGNWKAPSSSGYQIDYAAILNFIKNVGPSVFPSQLQSGRILYYSSIPSTIDTSTWPPTDLNQRFWKDYIDYVLGVMQVGSNARMSSSTTATSATPATASDFQWGTVKITALSSLSGSPKPYMHYGDNPQRPILSFWFGPMTMVDFLGNYNLWYTGYGNDCSRYCWWPGTCHESPMYACKLGIQAALNDMQNNHPNDFISLIMFSTPLTSSSDTGADRFNRVRVGLSQSYSTLTDSLWYPPATVGNSSATVTPYDSDNLEVPRAMGGTCYSMGLMLAYNQFSGNTALLNYNTSTLPAVNANDAGGGGRAGAQKIIIFETDGAPNTSASGQFRQRRSVRLVLQGPLQQRQPVRERVSLQCQRLQRQRPHVWSVGIVSLVNQLAALSTAQGYSTPSKPLLLHCIAFGPQITADGLSTLKQMQTAGNVTDGPRNAQLQDHQRECQHLCVESANSLCHDPAGWSPGVADPVTRTVKQGSPAMTRPIVEFQNVSKTYHVGLLRRRAIHALRDVSFKVRGGCVFGLLGPNRAGKTTLVKALLSICRPTSGTILRLGRDVAQRSTLGPGRLPARKPGLSAILDGPVVPRLLRRPVAALPAGTGGADSAAAGRSRPDRSRRRSHRRLQQGHAAATGPGPGPGQ